MSNSVVNAPLSLAEEAKKRRSQAMEELWKKLPLSMPKPDDLVEARFLERSGARAFFDMGPVGVGIVYGREYIFARDIIKNLKLGDIVMAKVLQSENEDGNIELSLREAGRDLVWLEAEELAKNKDVLELDVIEANKGGLVLQWKKMKGFLPASQLKTSHYPRVEGGDKDRIFQELKKLEGQKLLVTIIALDPKEDKIIFSEKGAEGSDLKELASKYAIGQVIEGEVTGVVDFGIFIKLEDGLEGLSHLSELDWSLVQNPHELFKIGDKVNAKIIGIESGRVSLSIKALKADPWVQAGTKYSKGDIVQGRVLRFNKYGALVAIEDGVSGLCHISEFGSADKMREKMEMGAIYPFQITLFEPKERRMTLSYLGEEAKAPELPKAEN
ncbi:S1 RNA-binding domain-containing protein [Candidatus Giovannonibacteria bacterium]|nr:S1 RNA-binding domain-containing protein [Candidatus Giovannonibacteria bacterium]